MSKKIHVRPGRGQSKVGFAVGIIFCLLGVFFVIPTFGLFGVFWTAIAGWIAYSHYRNGFTDQPLDTHVIDIEDDTTTTGKDMESRLKKLQDLYDQSLITYEEYEQKKKDILNEL